jgi:exodeoxyribonuclease-5
MLNDIFITKITEKLPFAPHPGQAATLRLLTEFLLTHSFHNRIFLLRGYAGTGKTSLVGALVKAMAEGGMKTVLMAPTGRAAKVLSFFAERPAMTIHKTIYRQHKFGAEQDDFRLMDNRMKQTLFICDEASMISTQTDSSPFGTGNLLDDLIEFVYGGDDCRLLLVGDAAQLPPVGQQRSPALDVATLRGYGLEVLTSELTEVARQQLDSGILYNATLIRSLMSRGLVEQFPRLHVAGYKDIRRITGVDLPEELASSYARCGLDDVVLVTRSNLRANRFNTGIRAQILDREEELTSGDRLLVVKNNYYWGRDFDTIPFIANGDIVEVVRVHGHIHKYGFRFAEASISFPDYEVDMEVLLLLDTLMVEGPSLPAERRQRLFYAVMEDYAHIPSQRDRIKAVKEDRFFNALEVKYGYALTCHKSQGGQWSDVYLDLGYINPDHLGLDFYRWLYTGITRARDCLYLVNMSDEMVADEEAEDEV